MVTIRTPPWRRGTCSPGAAADDDMVVDGDVDDSATGCGVDTASKGRKSLLITFLSSGGAGVMRARLESPRANYATPAPTRMTRALRQRQLPTNHGHAARPLGATRAYQPDSSSKTPHRPPRAVALRNSFERRGPGPPNNLVDGRSFHISYQTTTRPPHPRRRVCTFVGSADDSV